MKKRMLVLCAALCLTLSGCGNVVLERSYSSVSPHSAAYWENKGTDTLRADSYQDLVNAMLLLLGEHGENGTIRVYGDNPDAEAMMQSACNEVQQETALGAYLLDYITYTGSQERGYYELSVHFGYRRTQTEQEDIVNATSTEALPELLRVAAEQGAQKLTVRIGYFATDRSGVEQMVQEVQNEYPQMTAPWQLYFYPDTENPGIVEVILAESES